jgi:hypothetical protein
MAPVQNVVRTSIEGHAQLDQEGLSLGKIFLPYQHGAHHEVVAGERTPGSLSGLVDESVQPKF